MLVPVKWIKDYVDIDANAVFTILVLLGAMFRIGITLAGEIGCRGGRLFYFFSNSFATSCSSVRISRCCGQMRSHLPQRMQSDAREPGLVWTSS